MATQPTASPATPADFDQKFIPLGACTRCGASIFVIRPCVAGEWFHVPDSVHSCRCWDEDAR